MKCLFPYYVERRVYVRQEDRHVPVPCGQCPECLKRRSAQWTFRIMKELPNWEKHYFLTLTYDPQFCPMSKNGFMTLKKDDVQRFFKRLRKNTDGKLRYYMVGEYGTTGDRPHYHILLMADSKVLETDIVRAWIDPKTDLVLGHVHFGDIRPGSIQYTVGYMNKGRWRPLHDRDDRVPEYASMSKNLGLSWLTPRMSEFIISSPERPYVHFEGRKVALPTYYKRRIFDYSGGKRLLEQHPSYLVHFYDFLQVEKKQYNLVIQQLQDEKEQPEYTRELHEARGAAIRNYRRRHAKTRNLL